MAVDTVALTPAQRKRAEAKARRAKALAAIEAPPDPAINLAWYDLIVVNSSGGKDSLAVLYYVVLLARAAGVLDRVVVIHAGLGDVEWDGTTKVAKQQAEAYGVPFYVSQRMVDGKFDDLLAQVERRGMWMSKDNRYCTSDQKRDPIAKQVRALAKPMGRSDRPLRVLDVMGMRAQESPRRAKMVSLELDGRATAPSARAMSGRRHVWRWLPILSWTTEQVWQANHAAPGPVHPIYAQGMTRASCSFCILASRADLERAVELRPWLAGRYVALEKRIGHRFRSDVSMAEIVAAVTARCGGEYVLAA